MSFPLFSQLPPRPRKQPIMTREWWLYGNLPHTIFEAGCVLMSLALGLYLSTGVVQLNPLHEQCLYYKALDLKTQVRYAGTSTLVLLPVPLSVFLHRKLQRASIARKPCRSLFGCLAVALQTLRAGSVALTNRMLEGPVQGHG